MIINQGAVAVLCGLEGNCWIRVALAMSHRLCSLSTCRLNDLRKAEHPVYGPVPGVAEQRMA